MAKKRIVLREGFHVDGRDIVKCHFSEAKTVDMFDDESTDYLVVVDGKVKIIGCYRNEVFTNHPDAVELQKKRVISHLDFCEKQMEYYKNELGK